MKTKFWKAGGISKAVDLGLGRGHAPSLLLPVPSWGAQGEAVLVAGEVSLIWTPIRRKT